MRFFVRFFAWLRRHAPLTVLAILLLFLPILVTAMRGAPLIWQLNEGDTNQGALLYDIHGTPFTSLGERHSPYIPYSQLPVDLINAVVAIEDTRFWSHRGVDLSGIARAIVTNLRARERLQGGSTVTQQLARNLFLSREKTFLRKFKEAVYAILLEIRFSKREIMALYLNRSYFGEGAYGIGEAARTYFGKQVTDLTLAESALLVGLLKAPSTLTPYRDESRAIQRRDLIIDRMEELEMITSSEKHQALASPLRLSRRRSGTAPYFADYVRLWLVERFGTDRVFGGGLRVWTTLDLHVHMAAEDALGHHQGAIVAIQPSSGAITAMVGGRSFTESQFNRAIHAVRQPGSAFKPFVFAAALERGWQLNDLVEDVQQSYGDYTPKNFRDEYWGRVTLKHALVESLNNASVWLLQQIGPSAAHEMARRLGITTLTREDRNLALALGGITNGTTPLEMTAAYVPFANGGNYVKPYAVREVRSTTGELFYRHRAESRQVLSEEVAYLMTNVLSDAVKTGTGTAAGIGRPQAGKTGTTNELVSAWFVGYTPDLVAAVYVGEDDGTPLPGGGGTIAAPIWGRFASKALADIPAKPFSRPPSITEDISIDIFTGLRATDSCPHREVSVFIQGQEPKDYSPCTKAEITPQQTRPDPVQEHITPPEEADDDSDWTEHAEHNTIETDLPTLEHAFGPE